MTRMLILATALAGAGMLCGCSRPWTAKDREGFLGGCIGASRKDMLEEEARSYCLCMLQKVENRYPNANDAKYLRQDTAVYSMGLACRAQLNNRGVK
jgi:hypothetical protein